MEASRVNRAISETCSIANEIGIHSSEELIPHCLRQSDVVQIPAKILSILSDVYRQLSISGYLKPHSWYRDDQIRIYMRTH